MAATTTFTVALLLLLLLVAAPNAAKGNSFTVELIHRDSTRSPLSSHPDLSKPQRVRNAAARSLDRARSLERRLGLSSSVVSPMDAEAPVTADSGAYLVHVSLGTPAFPIVAIADTGSDVIWTQCQPCADCYTQTAPMFDPKSSTTYREISCSSETCTSLTDEGTSCSSDADVCHYQVTYGDGSNTSGDMATETLTLDSTAGRKVALPKTIFGCSHEGGGTFSPNASGIVGLGGGAASLVSQLGSTTGGKFSYCLASFGDDKPSTLTFGQSAAVSGGVSTPLLTDPRNPTFYFLRLDAISVGTKKIAFTGASGGGGGGNIIIDSGTTLTIVPKGVLSELADAVSSQVSGGTPVQVQGLDTCFEVEDSGSFEAPTLTMHFDGGADVELKTGNTFVEAEENVVCLAFAGSASLAIYGNVAQQNFRVGYDLKGETLSFEPADCTAGSSA
ncbi:unnamed protein product [Linum tenue]|uniref:Peptidase A1 domain-containing protein n=3 Tax=Linum tenue TaxID=586396 RepID=A0AAV0HQ39_9ROSI|nr:unnamed protein product [Linum tenue]